MAGYQFDQDLGGTFAETRDDQATSDTPLIPPQDIEH